MADTRVAQVFPPGEILKEELEARGWSQADFAEILGRQPKLVNELVAGKRAITPETAQAIADALATSPELWMNLEAQYQLYKARRTDPNVVRRAEIFAVAPVKEMQRRGWIEDTKDVDVLVKSVCAFYGTRSLEAIQTLPHAAKKSTVYSEDATPAQRAWVQRVRFLGQSVKASRCTKDSLARTLEQLKTLNRDRAEVRHVPKVLAEGGIRLVIVEPLAGTRIDGVCVWLSPSEPVIGLSVRYDRLDSFWFALAHELAHVANKDGIDNPIVDLELVGAASVRTADKPPRERAAGEFASNFLVPAAELSNFIARRAASVFEGTHPRVRRQDRCASWHRGRATGLQGPDRFLAQPGNAREGSAHHHQHRTCVISRQRAVASPFVRRNRSPSSRGAWKPSSRWRTLIGIGSRLDAAIDLRGLWRSPVHRTGPDEHELGPATWHPFTNSKLAAYFGVRLPGASASFHVLRATCCVRTCSATRRGRRGRRRASAAPSSRT